MGRTMRFPVLKMRTKAVTIWNGEDYHGLVWRNIVDLSTSVVLRRSQRQNIMMHVDEVKDETDVDVPVRTGRNPPPDSIHCPLCQSFPHRSLPFVIATRQFPL